jgi:hypothetical protein
MEERSVSARQKHHGSPETTTQASSRHRRGRLSRGLRRLVVTIAPMVATVVVSAPAGAWPEIGG